MKRFHVIRNKDISGVSGIGHVADGICFPSGQCVVVWISDHSSINIYKNLDDVIWVHGHGKSTEIKWIDEKDEPEK